MTQLSHHPAYLMIEDQLDAVGQKVRLLKIARGAMLWVGWGFIATVAAAFLADVAGGGRFTQILAGAWGAWLLVTFIFWFVRPVLFKPLPLVVAGMIERRIDGLHNGLTNGLLLSQAPDLAVSPWLGPIFDEIASNCEKQSLSAAVRLSDLFPLGLRLGAAGAAMCVLVALFPGRVAHGWQQMFAPTSFVPKISQTQILDVTPGDAMLISGQPLEIGVVASAPQSAPPAKIVFDTQLPAAELVGTLSPSDSQARYAYHIDHVDQPFRYRVEVGGTQSDWFTVQVAAKVTLLSMELTITPPTYTRLPVRKVTLSPSDIMHAPVHVVQGSKVEISAAMDVPAKQAVLMANALPPVAMTAAQAGRAFYGQTVITSDTMLYVGLLSGDSVIAKLPDNGLSIRCAMDGPPRVTMQYPTQDITLPPTQDILVKALLADDFGVSAGRLLVGYGDSEPVAVPESVQTFAQAPSSVNVQFPLHLTPEQSRHDSVVTVQVEATDDRDLTDISKDLGPQTAQGPKIRIRFADPQQIATQTVEQSERLSARLQEMIKLQQGLHQQTISLLPTTATTQPVNTDAFAAIGSGQTALRDTMRQTADTFEYTDRTRIIQKTLQVLAANAGTEAIDLSGQIVAEPQPAQQIRAAVTLKVKQESIIDALQMLLARLNAADEPATQPATITSAALPARADAFKKLDEAMKEYEKEQQRILNQTAPLAKKPVDNLDDSDKKKLDDLHQAQEKLDAFMEETLADFSKDAEQDLSNPALLKELNSVYVDVTMAKDALKEHSAETAVPDEENGLEQAKEIESNVEKWLANKPDRTEWTQEDPQIKTDTPMPELPKELEDMIGKLMEQQEDLDQKMEDANANWQDSVDKGIGWDAMDGPIADMSAKGVTGNTLPNNNEMQGRSGDGRSGQSSGEDVSATADDKGGRNTPTRLDPSPFQKGVIQDKTNAPSGGATSGGKISGEGAQGLEGPLPPKQKEGMQRLAGMQAALRNAAERLNLQYQVGRYDNFKLLQGIMAMRRVEADLAANRYQNALRRTDVVVDDLDTSGILLGGRMSVEEDATQSPNLKSRNEIDDAQQGELPPVWSEALREYYRKLAEQ